MIISILNQKGGVGKSTLAVNIARAYTLDRKKTLLVDTDRQGSSLRWHELSEGKLIDLTCLPTKTIDNDIKKIRDSYDRIIIDGKPMICEITMATIRAADLILIPVQPSEFDLWATEDLIRYVRYEIEMSRGKTKAAFVVSRKILGTNIGKEVYEELHKLELPVFKCGTSQRVAYATSIKKGLSVLDGEYFETAAHQEIDELVGEIEEFYHGTD